MKKILALLLAVSMLFCLAACGNSAASISSASAASEASAAASSASAQAPAEEPAEEPAAEPASAAEESSSAEPAEEASAVEEAPVQPIREVELPLVEDTENLTMWIRLNFMDTDPIQSNADSPIMQKAEELTNVHIDFTEVSSASESETFNLMIAGGDYTDIIYNFAKLYTEGVDSAIENDIIVDLSNYMDVTPCYESLLASDEDVRKTATTDSGCVGAYYSLYEDTPYTRTGLTMRGDWLEELGLEAPVTYDDMENDLLAIKDAYNPSYPLYLPSCGTLSEITMGYEFVYTISGDNATLFSQKDGQVMFSPTADSFREYLTMMHRWFDEGIISKDFATDGDWMFMNSEYQAMMSTGNTAIVSLGAGLYSEFESTGVDADENYSLVGIQNPRISEDQPAGTTPSSRVSDAIFSVSDANGNAELACRWCDFWYTEEGSMLSNYGIEGESYTLSADGTPEYTDYILNNADYSDRSMKNLYSFNTSCCIDPDKDLAGVSDSGLAAIEVWAADEPNESFSSINMTYLSMTTDESTQYGIICADAQTYCLENVLKFINGDLSIEDDWDNYVSVLQDMGVDEATEIVQAAYDRYLAR